MSETNVSNIIYIRVHTFYVPTYVYIYVYIYASINEFQARIK